MFRQSLAWLWVVSVLTVIVTVFTCNGLTLADSGLQGQVVDADGHPLCPASHSGAILDLSTAKLWLDVTETIGRSYNDIKGKLGTGGEFAGWRVATEPEIRQLFVNFGLPLTDGWSELVPANWALV